MSFTTSDLPAEIQQNTSAIILLNSSCQALIETSMTPVASKWYDTLNSQLGQIEDLIINWRQGGYLYFYNTNLANIIACGEDFQKQKTVIDALFKTLENNITNANKKVLNDALNALLPPINNIVTAINGYEAALKAYEINVQKVLTEMEKTIAAIQSQEQNIAEDIKLINTKIANLQSEIKTDREAIAKAKASKKRGIVDTIFGVLIIPFSFGLSSILAGIGVGTIVEADNKVSDMQNKIKSFQKDITSDTNKIAEDKQEISILNALLMSGNIMTNDINFIEVCLDSLKVSWGVLGGELTGTATKITDATDSDEIIITQTWFDAACNEWDLILTSARQLYTAGQVPITTNKVKIG